VTFTAVVRPHRAEALVDAGHADRDVRRRSWLAGPVDSRRMSAGGTTISVASVRRPAIRSISTVAAVSPMADRVADRGERRIGEGAHLDAVEADDGEVARTASLRSAAARSAPMPIRSLLGEDRGDRRAGR
jgi:hypothetical protein